MSEQKQGEGRGLPLPTYVSYLMYQTEQHRRALAADCIAQHGLSFAKWVALASLARFGECSMTRLARLSAADRTTLTRSIDGLIRDGLVERGNPGLGPPQGGGSSDRRKVRKSWGGSARTSTRSTRKSAPSSPRKSRPTWRPISRRSSAG
jgi:hypothetical protein